MKENIMRMKKFINDPQHLVDELLEGMVLAFPSKVELCGRNTLTRAVPKLSEKVRVVTLGGSGHEPGLSGFVGKGMLDYSVAGDIFAAPGATRCLDAMRAACAGGAAALLVVLNHAGDVLAANIAMEMALSEGCNIKMVLTREDISGGPNPDDRRGLVGFLPVFKVAGAAAEQGASLDACRVIALRMEKNMRSLAVAVNTATHPSTGQPIFELGDDEMEIGMGQHGEAGNGRMPLQSADETAAIMLNLLLEDLQVKSGEELLVLVNGAGATTLMELLIVFRRVAQLLTAKNIKLVRSAVGEFITTQEQAGFQLLIARMDPELIKLCGRARQRAVLCQAITPSNDQVTDDQRDAQRRNWAGCLLRRAAAVRVINITCLTELDSIGGDGDHGTTMLRAAEQWEAQPERWLSSETLNQLLQGNRMESAGR